MTDNIEWIDSTSKDEWLKHRTKDITSTESAAFFGLSPYITEFELWHRKNSGEVTEIADNPRMRAGRMLESGIAEMAAEDLGIEVEPLKQYARLPDLRIGSSFDFVATDRSALLEIKNVDYLVYSNAWTENDAPPHIEVQAQHQMLVTGIQKCYICALVGGNDLKIIERDYNPKIGAVIKKKVAAFWESIERAMPPDPDWERDAQFVQSLYQDSAEKVIEANETVEALVQQFNEAKEREKAAKKDIDVLKAKILAEIDDASKVKGDGWTLSCGTTKGSPAKWLHITEDMVGEDVLLSNERKGHRQFRLNFTKS